MKRAREETDEEMINHHFASLPATVVVVIAEFLEPTSLVSLIKVNRSVCQILSRHYCRHHGSSLSMNGMCQEYIETQIQNDGHNVSVFREKLATRTAKVDPNEWHLEALPPLGRTLPLDFDPVYRKYLEMLKECEDCELKATHMAMAGIGLVYCFKDCHEYVDTNSASCCQDCHNVSCCHDCGYWNGCPICGDDYITKDYFCEECRPMLHCDWCDRGYCMKHKGYKQLEMCCICTKTLCQNCHDGFDWCEGCHVYICNGHKKSYVCEKCEDVVCCWKCKDAYNCGHDGLYWKIRDREF